MWKATGSYCSKEYILLNINLIQSIKLNEYMYTVMETDFDSNSSHCREESVYLIQT